MPRQIIQGDIEVAENLLNAQRDTAQITATLVWRGLDEQTAIRLVEDLKKGRRVTVQPTDSPNTERDSIPWRQSSVANPPSAATKRDLPRGASKQQLPASNRRKLLAGVCVLFVLVITVLALPATRDEWRWLRVADDESVADEQAYLDAWPTGRHVGEARARIQRHAWSVAVGLASVEGFQSYLDAVPEGEHVAEARASIEALKWEAAVTANDLKHFERFLRDYPASQHVTEARAQIEALAQAEIERIRRIRSQLTDIFILPGAGGDGSGRDWQNACGSLKLVLAGNLMPGAKIHLAAGLIQESVAIPDNIHLICGYGRNARGMMELDPRSHRVFLMPPALGGRSMSMGRGCEISGLWLGMRMSPNKSDAGANFYTFWPSLEGAGKIELGDIGFNVEVDGFHVQDFNSRSQQFGGSIKGTNSSRGTGQMLTFRDRGAQRPAHLDRAPF